MIQTHNAKARAMLLECTLPSNMWAEAISTANYLHARSPTSSNNGMTPYEKLFGRKPEVRHLRRFGCKAFKTLPATHRSKFVTRADTLFMLGYVHDSTTIWRFWDPHRRQVIQASNVTFSEVGLGLGVDTSSGLRVDASCGLALDASRKLGLNASRGLGLGVNASHGLRLDASGGLELNSAAVELGLDAASGLGLEVNASSGLGLDASEGLELNSSAVRLGLDASSGLGLAAMSRLRLDVSSGSLVNLEENTGRYDLRKRPRAVAHRIQVEEEPIDSADPVSYREAIAHPRLGQKWSDAVKEELRSLAENSTWNYVRLEDVPAGVTPISSKWVFRTKELPTGGIRYKARLVIRDFEQQAGIDYNETFAPVAKLQSLGMMITLAATHDWEIDQMDVVTAFLNPKVDGDVYLALL